MARRLKSVWISSFSFKRVSAGQADGDPHEMKDVAADAAMPGELDLHRRLLAGWNKTTEEDKHPVRPSSKKPRRKAKRKR